MGHQTQYRVAFTKKTRKEGKAEKLEIHFRKDVIVLRQESAIAYRNLCSYVQ